MHYALHCYKLHHLYTLGTPLALINAKGVTAMNTMARMKGLLAAAVVMSVSSAFAAGTCAAAGVAKPAEAAEKKACTDCTAPKELVKPAAAAEAKTEEASAKAQAEINTAGLKALISSKAPLVLLDARSGKWDDKTRIPGAVSLAPDAGDEVVAKLLPDKNALIVTYCGSLQCPASAKLAAKLKTLGYTGVVEYSAGIAGWKEAGHQVDTVK
jgi:rhodanese-related sulfurtransferase